MGHGTATGSDARRFRGAPMARAEFRKCVRSPAGSSVSAAQIGDVPHAELAAATRDPPDCRPIANIDCHDLGDRIRREPRIADVPALEETLQAVPLAQHQETIARLDALAPPAI